MNISNNDLEILYGRENAATHAFEVAKHDDEEDRGEEQHGRHDDRKQEQPGGVASASDDDVSHLTLV